MEQLLTLHDVHEWIANTREIAYDPIRQTMLSGKDLNIVITADEAGHYSPEELQAIQKKFRKLIDAIIAFDNDFHTSFDCQ